MSTLDVAHFKKDHNIDAVIDLLAERGYDYIKNLKNITYVSDDGANIQSVDIFSRNVPINEDFIPESKILSKISNLTRAIYVVIGPNSIVPEHVDDDSKDHIRITSGVLTDSNSINDICFFIEDMEIGLFKNISVGFEAGYKIHKGYNRTNKPWIVLVLMIDRNNISAITNYV